MTLSLGVYLRYLPLYFLVFVSFEMAYQGLPKRVKTPDILPIKVKRSLKKITVN
jgi:hypothetical protein